MPLAGIPKSITHLFRPSLAHGKRFLPPARRRLRDAFAACVFYAVTERTPMMTQLDTLFDSLRAAPAPDALDAIEAAVFTGVARQREKAVSRRGLILAGVISMVVGTTASLFPSSEARADPNFGIPANAPSHLLAP